MRKRNEPNPGCRLHQVSRQRRIRKSLNIHRSAEKSFESKRRPFREAARARYLHAIEQQKKLEALLRANGLTWCDAEKTGFDFARMAASLEKASLVPIEGITA